MVANLTDTIVVVPCFNEALRLPVAAFESFLEDTGHIHFLFVDDGSTDATRQLLCDLRRRHPGRVELLIQPQNRGKAEAVRAGVLRAIEREPALVGFWDADLATPLDAIPDFVAVLEDNPEVWMVMGARVQLLGRTVERSPARHYLGRIFATAVSVMLQLPVYDTQCGAKIFRRGSALRTLFELPFLSKWVFDVEILARELRRLEYNRGAMAASIYEYPLRRWVDVAGSKVKPADFLAAFLDVVRIYRTYLFRRG